MTPFLTRNDSNQRTACARSVRVRPTRLLSSLQICKVPSLSQQHRQGSHRIQVHTNQHPTSTHVPSRAMSHVAQNHPNTIRTDSTSCHKTRFPRTPLSEMMSATIPSQWNVLHPLTLVPSAQRNGAILTSVTRDQSSRRRELKAASSR